MAKVKHFKHQLEGKQFLADNPFCLLAHEPGLGKTRCLAEQAAEVGGNWLIVAPAMLEDTWDREIAKWAPELSYYFISYQSLCERTDEKQTKKGVVRSKTGARSLVLPHPKAEVGGVHWDGVIFDECHNLKDKDTNWTLASFELEADRVWLATGTPIPNWAHELFIPAKMVHPAERAPGKRYGSYWRWVRRWFTTWDGPWGGIEIGGLKGCDNECKALIREGRMCDHYLEFARGNNLDVLMQVRRRDECLDLPPLLVACNLNHEHGEDCGWYVSMTSTQKKAYDQMKKQFFTEIEGKTSSVFLAGPQAVKLNKLAGGLFVENPDVANPVTGSCKLQALNEIMADRRGTHTLVFCQFRNSATQVAKQLTEQGFSVMLVLGGDSDVKRVESRWQTGEHQVLVGTIDAIREGLNLQIATGVIFFEHSWSPWKNEQAVRRAHRIGTTGSVMVYHIWTRGTVDIKMKRVLREKTEDQIRTMTAIEWAKLLEEPDPV